MLSQKQKPQKVCFVTVGATASFDALIEATLSPPFLEALKKHDYTHLRLQHGKDGQKVLEGIDPARRGIQDLSISGFDFNKQGLGSEMRAAKGEDDRREGVVVSHAGRSFTSTLLMPLQAYVSHRIRLYPRRPTDCGPHHCRAQSGLVGQSPGRVGRRVGDTRLRDSWTPQVRSPGSSCQDKPR